jgi:hypothetical protein
MFRQSRHGGRACRLASGTRPDYLPYLVQMNVTAPSTHPASPSAAHARCKPSEPGLLEGPFAAASGKYSLCLCIRDRELRHGLTGEGAGGAQDVSLIG